MTTDPSAINMITTGTFQTAYHDAGDGDPVLLVHGSGPGVSAWANWRGVIPQLMATRRVVAPDMLGFGRTQGDGVDYSMATWTRQAIDLLDALGIAKTDLIGNSFGGALALRLAIDHPDRINRLVLMGPMGVSFPITDGLDYIWGYTPSMENMAKAINLFADNKALMTDDLIRMRYEASSNPVTRASYEAMFPAPRQRWVEAMASTEDEIRGIKQRTLIIHGREDQIIPPHNSLQLFHLIDQAQLHLFGHCGHWTQIEKLDEFCQIVETFLSAP